MLLKSMKTRKKMLNSMKRVLFLILLLKSSKNLFKTHKKESPLSLYICTLRLTNISKSL